MTTTETRPAIHLRRAVVRAVERPTPRVLRVTFAGPDLADLPVVAPDGYLKLFFPRPGEAAPVLPTFPDGDDVTGWFRSYLAMPDEVRPPMRTYTLRRRREDPVEFDVDFVLHAQGPARDWALGAGPGDHIAFTGPYGLWAPRPEHDWVLLVGDETAVPAIGAIVESLPAGTRAVVLAAVRDAGEHLVWDTAAEVDARWLYASGATLPAALASLDLPAGRPYVWLSGEAGVVRDLRRHVTRERAVPKDDICFTGYWRRGRTEEQEVRAALAGDATPEDD